MALITCPECGNQISDKASNCPFCGAPISTAIGSLTVTRKFSDYMEDYLLHVDIDDGFDSFDIAVDETFDIKLLFGIHSIAISYHKSLLCSRTITMNEDYCFVFTIGPEHNVIILNNSGTSKKRKIADVSNTNTKRLICPCCHSQNIHVQMINEQRIVKKKHGLIYWLCFGWVISIIVWIIKWFVFTVPAIIFKLFGIGGKKKQIVNEYKTFAVCQECGHSWQIE